MWKYCSSTLFSSAADALSTLFCCFFSLLTLLPCLVIPRVVVLVGAAVNHLGTGSPGIKMASTSLRDCVHSQFWFPIMCSVGLIPVAHDDSSCVVQDCDRQIITQPKMPPVVLAAVGIYSGDMLPNMFLEVPWNSGHILQIVRWIGIGTSSHCSSYCPIKLSWFLRVFCFLS